MSYNEEQRKDKGMAVEGIGKDKAGGGSCSARLHGVVAGGISTQKVY
jgi:hypothetical protein